MTMISDYNREEWFFNYHEGQLTSKEKWEVEKYVLEHPEYRVEFDAWASSFVQTEGAVYANVDGLIQKEGGSRFRMFGFIAAFLMGAIATGTYFLNDFNNVTPIYISDINAGRDSQNDGFSKNDPLFTSEENNKDFNLIEVNTKSDLQLHSDNNISDQTVIKRVAKKSPILNNNTDRIIEEKSLNSNDKSAFKTSSNKSDNIEVDRSTLASDNSSLELTIDKNSLFVSNKMNKSSSVLSIMTEHESVIYNEEDIDLSKIEPIRIVSIESSVKLYVSRMNNNTLDDSITPLLAADYNSDLVEEEKSKSLKDFIYDLPFKKVKMVNILDPYFAVVGIEPTNFTPSLIGGRNKMRYDINNSNGQMSFEGEQPSFDYFMSVNNFGFDRYIDKIKGGIGLNIQETSMSLTPGFLNFVNANDQSMIKNQKVTLGYSAKVLLTDKWQVEPAVGINYNGTTFNQVDSINDLGNLTNAITFNSDIIPQSAFTSNLSMSLGLQVNHKQFYGGLAVHNLFTPENNVLLGSLIANNMDRKPVWNYNVGTTFRSIKNDKLAFTPMMFGTIDSGSIQNWLTGSFSYAKNYIRLGLSNKEGRTIGVDTEIPFDPNNSRSVSGLRLSAKCSQMNDPFNNQKMILTQFGLRVVL